MAQQKKNWTKFHVLICLINFNLWGNSKKLPLNINLPFLSKKLSPTKRKHGFFSRNTLFMYMYFSYWNVYTQNIRFGTVYVLFCKQFELKKAGKFYLLKIKWN